MLIGIDASRANKLHKSGTEWYAFYLIRELARLDKDNQYILYTDRPLIGGLADLSAEEVDPMTGPATFDQYGFQTLVSPHHNFRAKVLSWPFKFFWTLGGLSLEMLFHKPDLLFVPAHTLPLIHPRRSVVTIHDIGFKRNLKLYEQDRVAYRNNFINTLVRLFTLGRFGATQTDYLDWSTAFALKAAHKVITISEFSRQELISVYQADPAKIAVVHNGYNNQIYRQLDRSDAEATLRVNGITTPFIFYVGRLEKKKNISELIEAFALIKHHHPEIKHKLVLVGDASYGFDEVKYNISEYNLEREVLMPGWIEEKSLPDIYNAASAFIFPSNYEGFGIPLLQAMACGTPIAASDIAPVREVVADCAVLFDPNSPADMADKIFALISDQALQSKLSASGLARVNDFSWRKCASETLDILQS
jgi:glycosyltransferase involved in cell wall biosynthesis